jgi:hypothetical protein
MAQTYKLTATTLSSGKIMYKVIDQDGNVISKRVSTRKYVACTIDGSFYFGRIDLIGHGDHGAMLARIRDCECNTEERYNNILEKGIREIKVSNRLHLECYKENSTQEQLNAPINPSQRDLLVRFCGKDVADKVNTQWEYQVAMSDNIRCIQDFKREMGDFESWKKRREAWVAEVKPGMQVAILQ